MTSRGVRGGVPSGFAWGLVSTAMCAAGAGGCRKGVTEQVPVRDDAPVPPAAPAVSTVPLLAAPQSERVTVSAEAKASCSAVCERSKQLKCKNTDECLPNCLAMVSLTPCTKEISAMLDCTLREPIARWECAEDGVGAIRDGYCDEEQGKAVTCMEQKMQP